MKSKSSAFAHWTFFVTEQFFETEQGLIFSKKLSSLMAQKFYTPLVLGTDDVIDSLQEFSISFFHHPIKN